MTFNSGRSSKVLPEEKKVQLLDPDAEDATIRLKNIKIKDAQMWAINSADTRSSRSSIDSQETEGNELTIQEEVEVTFYRMRLFTSMFPDYFANFDVLYQSLSPTFNRDNVF